VTLKSCFNPKTLLYVEKAVVSPAFANTTASAAYLLRHWMRLAIKNGELVMLSPQQLIVSPHASTLRKHRTGAAQFCPSQDALAIKKKRQTNHVIPTTNRVSVVIW
jgi:hypothetical protein